MYNRIKNVRKTLHMTQAEFGNRIGISRDAIANIEGNRVEVKDFVIKAICREFNVDYIWLTIGEGEMFVDADIETTAIIDRILAGENEFHKNILKVITRLNADELQTLESIIDKYIEAKKEGDQRN